jgi:putative SOS response-associated peptidase YedK
MCGRFDFHSRTDEIAALLPIVGEVDPQTHHYNLAPTHLASVAVATDDGAQLEGMAFGWRWSHRPGMVLNARAETVQEKPTFRRAFAQRRCLVFANGFFEWAWQGKHKQPYYFSVPHTPVFAFAGLYSTEAAGGRSFVILTTEANATVGQVHHRMPVILPQAALHTWLHDGAPPPLLQDLLVPFTHRPMQAHAVGLAVNNARYNAADCIVPVSPAPAGKGATDAPKNGASSA